ncbi:TPA: hypothetical protein I7764_04050 [Vibrio vulnificus]|nr:hypothetical protein [Vibrio vulnificus]
MGFSLFWLRETYLGQSKTRKVIDFFVALKLSCQLHGHSVSVQTPFIQLRYICQLKAKPLQRTTKVAQGGN